MCNLKVMDSKAWKAQKLDYIILTLYNEAIIITLIKVNWKYFDNIQPYKTSLIIRQ